MIRIGKIHIEEHNGRTRLVANVHLSKKVFSKWEKNCPDQTMESRYHREFADDDGNWNMWFEVETLYQKMLCTERSDAFVVACLYYAMVTGEDIQCDVPVTRKLLYQLNEYFIPAICRKKEGIRRVKIIADDADNISGLRECVGTGVSCGVDSFSTILLNMREDIPQGYNLTHLTLFNTGSMNFSGYSKGESLKEWRRNTKKEFDERIAIGKAVAKNLKLDFIDIDSNIPDLYQGCFMMSNTYRNCSAVLATQKMWRTYYYASAGEKPQLQLGLAEDNDRYDAFLLQSISLDRLTFYSGGLPYERMEKTTIIADNPVVQKYLNVCSFETRNCGQCEKCLRTMMALDLLGKLDLFKDSFTDMSFFYSNKWKYRAIIMEADESKPLYYDMKEYMKRENIGLDTKSKIYHFLLPLRLVWKKMHGDLES